MAKTRGRYSQTQRDSAIAALMASAVLVDGELQPNYRQVARSTNIARSTLRSWWQARDRDEDRQLSPPLQRARAQAREQGATQLLQDLVATIEQQVAYIAHPAHYDTRLVVGRDGCTRVAGVPLHQAARALQSLVHAHRHLQTVLIRPDQMGAPDDTLQRAREAVRRTGLDKLYSQSPPPPADVGSCAMMPLHPDR